MKLEQTKQPVKPISPIGPFPTVKPMAQLPREPGVTEFMAMFRVYPVMPQEMSVTEFKKLVASSVKKGKIEDDLIVTRPGDKVKVD
jgi:hypothetical protein